MFTITRYYNSIFQKLVNLRINCLSFQIANCTRCGSKTPKHYKGTPGDLKMKGGKWGGRMTGTRDVDCGTKDTHINFGERLDEMDWNEADEHCGKADLCIIAGTSMSLRHITHFPFMAKKVVLINLQATPDDNKAHLRLWARCDPVFSGLMERLGLEVDPIPVWRPRDSVPIHSIPSYVHPYYVEAAKRLEQMALFREAELAERQERQMEIESESEKENEDGKRIKEKTALRLALGNTHNRSDASGESCPHEWTVFLRPVDEETRERMKSEVEWVEFELHSTFSPNIVRVDRAPFEVTRKGWGYFTVGVRMQTKNSSLVRLSHQLNFNSPHTYREISL